MHHHHRHRPQNCRSDHHYHLHLHHHYFADLPVLAQLVSLASPWAPADLVAENSLQKPPTEIVIMLLNYNAGKKCWDT